MFVVKVLLQICLVAQLCITQMTNIISFLMSFHVTPQAERLHDLVALVTLCSPLHPHPVFNLLVVDDAVLGEELQAADAAVAGEVLQGQLGHVCIQGLSIFVGEVHLRWNMDEISKRGWLKLIYLLLMRKLVCMC